MRFGNCYTSAISLKERRPPPSAVVSEVRGRAIVIKRNPPHYVVAGIRLTISSRNDHSTKRREMNQRLPARSRRQPPKPGVCRFRPEASERMPECRSKSKDTRDFQPIRAILGPCPSPAITPPTPLAGASAKSRLPGPRQEPAARHQKATPDASIRPAREFYQFSARLQRGAPLRSRSISLWRSELAALPWAIARGLTGF